MTVSDWFGIALLLILSALAIGMFLHIALTIGQLRRVRKQDANSNSASTKTPLTQFQTRTELPAPKLRARDALPTQEKLTKREIQVARLAAHGLTDVEIAAKLVISERTVGNHLYNIYRKLHINSRRELKYVLQEIEDDS